MTILQLEGFEHLDTGITDPEAEDYISLWFLGKSLGNATPIVASRTGFLGLQFNLGNFITTRKLQQADGNTTLILGFYYKTPSAFSNGTDFFRVWCGPTEQCQVEWNGGGTLDFKRSSTILGTSTYTFATSNEYYIEFKVVIDDTVGSLEMKVADITAGGDDTETATEWTVSGVDNRNSSSSLETAWDQVTIYAANTNTVIDDIYIANGAGTYNTDFLGNIFVESITPTGAGNNTEMTPSTGSNWQNVDDGTPHDGDTTYNTADADLETDLYECSALSETGDVFAVQVQAISRVTSGNPRVMRLPVRSSTTTGEGSDIVQGNDAYTGKTRIVEENPATTSLWTNGEVNTIEIGVKRQS